MAKKQKRSMPKRWADPKAAQTAKRGVRPPRRTLWLRTGLTAALVLAAVVVGSVLLISPNSSGAGQDARFDHEVSALLAGIPQEGRTLGAPAAPVTLQLFADLKDDDSQRWVLTLLPAIIDEFVRPGILKIEYRSYKTNTITPKRSSSNRPRRSPRAHRTSSGTSSTPSTTSKAGSTHPTSPKATSTTLPVRSQG